MSDQLKPTFISQFPATKQGRKALVAGIRQNLEEGNENALKLAVAAKQLEAFHKDLKEDKKIKELILSEASKYGSKTFEAFGAEVTITNAGVKYDYSVCQDSEWLSLKHRFDQLKIALDARQEWLKTLKEPYINQETGECIMPPIKTGTETVAITLK